MERKLDVVLEKINMVIGDNEKIGNIKRSLEYQAPECQWDYVYWNLIYDYIPPRLEKDFKVLAIWMEKSVEELKGLGDNSDNT